MAINGISLAIIRAARCIMKRLTYPLMGGPWCRIWWNISADSFQPVALHSICKEEKKSLDKMCRFDPTSSRQASNIQHCSDRHRWKNGLQSPIPPHPSHITAAALSRSDYLTALSDEWCKFMRIVAMIWWALSKSWLWRCTKLAKLGSKRALLREAAMNMIKRNKP